MNAAQLLTVASSTGNSIRSQVNQQTSINAGGFTQMLMGVLYGSSESSIQEINSVEDPKVKDVQAEIDSSDLEQLLVAFEELFGMLPMNEGFFDPKLLQDPDILALLNQMPQPMQQLLSKFIGSEMSFEQVLSQTEKGSKEQLTLLLMTIFQLEKNGQFPEQLKQIDFVKLVQKQLNDVVNSKIPEQQGNVALLVTKLIETLEKRSTTDSVKGEVGQPITQMKSELTQIIQRVLNSDANKQGNQNNSSEQQGATKVVEITGTQSPFDATMFDEIVNSSIKDGGSVNRIQQYVLNVSQPTGAAMSEEQILNQLKHIMKQSKFSTLPNGTNQLMIRLNPAHLGSLTIKLSESNGEMMARIIASSATARDVIESNLNALRHVFTTQNINVEKFELAYQGDSQFESAKKEQNDQEQSKSKQDRSNDQIEEQENVVEINSFKEELLNIIV